MLGTSVWKCLVLSGTAVFAVGCQGQVGAPIGEPSESPRSPGASATPTPNPSDPGLIPDGPVSAAMSMPPPPRVVRLDGPSYVQTMATLLEGRAADEQTDWSMPRGLATVFNSVNPSDRFSTRYRSYHIDATQLGLLEDNADQLARTYVRAQENASCSGTGMEDEGCQREWVTQAGARLFRRPLTDGEIDEAMGVVDPTVPAGVRLETRIKGLILQPATLFRLELGMPGASGSVPLALDALASALSYTLAQRPPDAPLYAAAVDGRLGQAPVYAAAIDRMMQSPRHRERVKVFLREYFRYAEAINVAKDEDPKEVLPEGTPGRDDARYNPRPLVEDTDRLVAELVETARYQDFLQTLLTTRVVYVRKNTATFYNTASESDAPERVELANGQRQGILTQPSWLVAFSETDHTNPIRRGKFIQESLLCGQVPDIPIDGVPPLELEGKTVRQALVDHTQTETTCYGCHHMMDPMGLPFEQFDHFGAFRTEERGAPVETDGALTWSQGAFDATGPVQDPFELTSRLAGSKRVLQCFVEHVFEFWMGRSVAEGDARAIATAMLAYETSGGDFDAALKAILQSDVFRMRTLP